jgi:hypothetical protein
MAGQSVLLSKWYLFYLVLVRPRHAGQRKTIATMYGPESGSDVEQSYSLKNFPQIDPHHKWKRLTNATDIVESSKPQVSLLLTFTQTRTRNARADHAKNNAAAVLSQGPRLSDILGRANGLLAHASNASWKKGKVGAFIQEQHTRSEPRRGMENL